MRVIMVSDISHRMHYFKPLIIASALFMGACAAPTEPTQVQNQAAATPAQTVQGLNKIVFSPKQGSGFPEGVAWLPKRQAFLVSSLRGGTVGLVAPDGQWSVFADDPRLMTTSGILVDAARNRVLVANEDVGVSPRSTSKTMHRTAQVFELDIDSGRVRHVYDFSGLSQGATLSNDLTVDAHGHIYVTDSFQPQIYKAAYDSKAVSVLVRDARLKPQSDDQATGLLPNLNGIVYHPDGFLLAGDYVQGKLWRIPLQQPEALVEVRLPERLKGPDGLVLLGSTALVAVQTYQGEGGVMHSEVTTLTSSDGWRSASVQSAKSLPDVNGATTGAVVDGQIWVVNSRFPQLFGNEQADEVREFELIRVPR